MALEIELTEAADYLCDYTFNFQWHNRKIGPDYEIPGQEYTHYTYGDLIGTLRAEHDVNITGDVGRNFAYSMGADLKHFGGSGDAERTGNISVDGNAGPEAAMGMVSGSIYISGRIEEPLGNIIEVVSDRDNYRKFRSITDIACNGPGSDTIISNEYNADDRTLVLNDGILRGTIGARCYRPVNIIVGNNAHNGTGVLMKEGVVTIHGNSGMNTGSHLNGGTVAIHGKTGEFAGAYMKNGILAFHEAKGFIGAGMSGGSIYSKSKAKTSSPAAKVKMKGEDSALMRRLMDAGRVESMIYNKYGFEEEKEKYIEVRMRDGSIVLRKAD
ncbi:formylmethanofuran dehydrogenase [Methanolobus halotolerans]|uniref:Formylmethanofuran dehydrogenase n=1 Tax=Methanolobus halotolerans TaxID=2052935 RepID=A0A4E0Q8L0_9EURY|nr:formylmethanofuran dehydrogenase [Methanolobus halotolerans]TGC11314.1 formylmethanofuran dehydrogenase [Methanolobus halotolerans]